MICRGKANGLQLGGEFSRRLLAVNPSQELPDSAEVIYVVDQRCTRQGNTKRVVTRRARDDAVCQCQYVLGTLRGEVLDEVCFINDHALEAHLANPGQVAVQNFVIDDEHVCEGVHVRTVTVDNGCLAAWNPTLNFTGPVHLHHVGNDGQKRERVGNGCCNERLCSLTQTRLICQQEGAVTFAHALNEANLVWHELATLR